MNDTSKAVRIRYEEMIMSRSLEDRIKMGCSMFDTAKQIARSAMQQNNLNISAAQIKRETFLRFYGREFLPNVQKKILSVMEAI